MTKVTPRDILIAEGAGNFVGTFFAANDAVRPGTIVTNTGGAQKKVDWPDTAGDCALGVVGCNPGHDIDTGYTAVTDSFPVYYVGSGAVVWVRTRTNAGAIVAGTPIMSDGGTADGLAIIAADSATVFTTAIGRATHWMDNIASEAWVKVRLGGV